MAKAVTSCCLKQDEFNHLELNKIIEFQKTDPNQYEIKHWNAVLLYNYIAQACYNIFGGDRVKGVRDRVNPKWIGHIGELIKEKYSTVKNIETKINTAISNIEYYVKTLKLDDYIFYYRNCEDTGIADINMAPNANLAQNYDQEHNSGEFCIPEACVTKNGKNVITPIVISVQDGKIKDYKTKVGTFAKLTSNMTLEEAIPQSRQINIDGEILDKNNIHNLTNFGNVDKRLTMSKCYFNAAMEALHASPSFRRAIDELSGLQPQLANYMAISYIPIKDNDNNHKYQPQFSPAWGYWTVSHVIKKFFDGIENGSMDQYAGQQGYNSPEADQNYTNALRELISGLEANRAKREQLNADIYVNNLHNFSINDGQNLGQRLYKANNIAAEAELRGNPLLKAPDEAIKGGMVSDIMTAILRAVGLELKLQLKDPLTRIRQVEIRTLSKNGNDFIKLSSCDTEGFSNIVAMQTTDGDLQNQTMENLKLFGKKLIEARGEKYIDEGNWDVFDETYKCETTNKFLELPQILICQMPQVTQYGEQGLEIRIVKDVKFPERLVCNDDIGKKVYTLVSTVDATSSTGGHFVAAIRTKTGWVEANDTYNCAHEGATNGIVSRESPTTYKNGRKPVLALYELTETIEKDE